MKFTELGLEHFKTRVEEGVGILEINRPPANAHNLEVLQELDQAIMAIRFDNDVKAVIFTSALARFFSAGFDITVLRDQTPEYVGLSSQFSKEVMLKIQSTRKIFIAAINGHCMGGGLELAMAESSSPRYLRNREPGPDDPAFWLYSSGSTGAPKAAVHLHKDMMVCNRLYAEGILHITQQDRLFSASKLFFAYGLGNGSYFALANEASVVLEPRKPDALTVLQDIAHYRPTIFFGVPTLFNAILRHPQSRDHDLSSLRACVSAGEPLPAEIYTRWKTAYGVEILDGIGSTEVLHIYISKRPGQSTPGNTGSVVPGYAVQILDDQMHVVDPGTVGDLYVQGDSISPYYWGQYQKTRSSMIGEWFKTGDKYYEDGDGHFVYCGRSDDMIKAGGIWVSPIEVENVLLEHPAVAETAVIGVLDADDLAKPVAYVVLGDEENPSERLATELQEFVKGRLAHYKYPREIHFVEELPKTASGKIQRYRLRNGMVTS